jgi:nitrogenase molybdenum-iron protein NifN
MNNNIDAYSVTKNACKLCNPLGASLAFKGIENAITILHGSQGCSTYIRRYMISHFKEPIDIASSNFSENTAIFGGASNLKMSIDNIRVQYAPDVIGVATTCLSETIGDDIERLIKEYIVEHENENLPEIIPVSTPSYNGTHFDGFINAISSIVNIVPKSDGKRENTINIFSGMVSPRDLRYIKEIIDDFKINYILCPDYSDTLEGGLWTEYCKIPKGGTPLSSIKKMGNSSASIEFGRITAEMNTAGKVLMKNHNVRNYACGLPIGINETDRFFEIIEKISKRETPLKYSYQRERLIDAYADGHKYIFGLKVCVYGEEDLVVGLSSFLDEIGIAPVIYASGGKSGYLKEKVGEVLTNTSVDEIAFLDDADFGNIEEKVKELKPDLIIGNSKGYKISRHFNIPLIRIGFPIHDRFGASRILHLGYRGAQELFDRIVNAIIEKRQESSSVGYTYI